MRVRILRVAAFPRVALVVSLTAVPLLQGQVAELAGEWQVVRQTAIDPSASPFVNWLHSLPGAVFTLSPSVIPPLARVFKHLDYTYLLSKPTVSITQGRPDKPTASGFLQEQGGRLEGEMALSGGCWIHLSLERSADGSMLSGSARINTKISTRSCLGYFKKGKRADPFPYTLVRLN